MHGMYAPNTVFASNLEYIVKPTNLCVISSNVGALWCLWVIALLKSYGSSHTLKASLALQ